MSDIPLERIKQLTEFARANNLTKIECDGVKLEFGPREVAPTTEERLKEMQRMLAKDDLTPEQALFNSAPQWATREEVQALMRGMGHGTGE
jgi:hypothetical protein